MIGVEVTNQEAPTLYLSERQSNEPRTRFLLSTDHASNHFGFLNGIFYHLDIVGYRTQEGKAVLNCSIILLSSSNHFLCDITFPESTWGGAILCDLVNHSEAAQHLPDRRSGDYSALLSRLGGIDKRMDANGIVITIIIAIIAAFPGVYGIIKQRKKLDAEAAEKISASAINLLNKMETRVITLENEIDSLKVELAARDTHIKELQRENDLLRSDVDILKAQVIELGSHPRSKR